MSVESEIWKAAAVRLEEIRNIDLLSSEEYEKFLGSPGQALISIAKAGNEDDDINLALLRIARTTMKEGRDDPFRFPIEWSSFEDDVRDVFELMITLHGVLAYLLLKKHFIPSFPFEANEPYSNHPIPSAALSGLTPRFFFKKSWLPNQMLAEAPIQLKAEKDQMADAYCKKNQTDIGKTHFDFGYSNARVSVLVLYTNERYTVEKNDFPVPFVQKIENLRKLAISDLISSTIDLLFGKETDKFGRSKMLSEMVTTTTEISDSANSREGRELFHGRSIGKLGKLGRGSFGLYIAEVEDNVAAGKTTTAFSTTSSISLSAPSNVISPQPEQLPPRKADVEATVKEDNALLQSAEQPPEQSPPAKRSYFLTAAHVAPYPGIIQAPGGTDVGLQLNDYWKKGAFTDEQEVARIMRTVREVGKPLMSKMGTSPRGFREDWSLCESLVDEEDAKNGFGRKVAVQVLARLCKMADQDDADYLINVAGAEDAGLDISNPDKVAKYGATTKVTGGTVNFDGFDYHQYRKNSAVGANESVPHHETDPMCTLQVIMPFGSDPLFATSGDSGSAVFKLCWRKDGTPELIFCGLLVSALTVENAGMMIPQSELWKQLEDGVGKKFKVVA